MSKCCDCKYAKHYSGTMGFEDFECTRHAPVMEKVESWRDGRVYVPRFPIMNSGQSCGDFVLGKKPNG